MAADDQVHDEAGWEDVEPDEEQLEFASLFGPEKFPDIQSMADHDRASHNFDLAAIIGRLSMF